MPEDMLPADHGAAPVARRYRSIEEHDGTLVIYDDDSDGWVRSDEWVAVGSMR